MRDIERRRSVLLGAALVIASAAAGCSTLRVVPLIDTPLGTMRSPVPITIMRKRIGADRSR